MIRACKLLAVAVAVSGLTACSLDDAHPAPNSSSDHCTTEELHRNPDIPADVTIVGCDGDFAQIAAEGAPQPELYHWDGEQWSHLEPDGNLADGYDEAPDSWDCYSDERLAEMGASDLQLGYFSCEENVPGFEWDGEGAAS